MRAAKRPRTALTASIPAPVGGLNARDSIANMPATDAIRMDNWVPGTTSISLRKGYAEHVTGFASAVESLMPWNGATSRKFFAASGTAFYDVTSAGAVGAAVQSGLTNARWQWANFGTGGGQYLYCVNGADNARLYDGSSWVAVTGVSTPAITGVNTNTFKDVQVFGRRLWFTEKNSFKVWYLGIDSIGGAATSIDFAPLFILGGSLQGMVTWYVSSELSTTAYACFVSSEGEVLMYEGTDPASAATWQLAATFRVGKPIGQRFYERIGSDTVLITEDGLMPMSKAAFSNRQNQSSAISYKIINQINTDIQSYRDNFGWDLILFPLGNRLVCNAPRPSSNDTVQYVMNTITNQWCRYTGMPAYVWCLFDDDIYFGGPTAVYKAETGYADNGAGISADIIPAFSYFRTHGQQKLFTAIRPIISANGDFEPKIGLCLDFNINAPISTPNLSLGGLGSPWDTSPWDTSPWSVTTLSKGWHWIGGMGFAASLRMKSITKDMTAEWQSTDYVYEAAKGVF